MTLDIGMCSYLRVLVNSLRIRQFLNLAIQSHSLIDEGLGSREVKWLSTHGPVTT